MPTQGTQDSVQTIQGHDQEANNAADHKNEIQAYLLEQTQQLKDGLLTPKRKELSAAAEPSQPDEPVVESKGRKDDG